MPPAPQLAGIVQTLFWAEKRILPLASQLTSLRETSKGLLAGSLPFWIG
jgi:hypothetical protein